MATAAMANSKSDACPVFIQENVDTAAASTAMPPHTSDAMRDPECSEAVPIG